MKCDKCGATLRDDQVFCPECGCEMQLVANYNPTEDEIMGFDSNIFAPADTDIQGADGVGADKAGLSPKIKRIIICVIIALVLIAGGTSIYFYLENDYGHQFNKAKEAMDRADYTTAIKHGLSASNLDARSLDAKWLLVNAYTGSKEYGNALDMVKDILSMTSNDAEVYDRAMSIFIDVEDYKDAAALLETTTDMNIREKYNMYIASPPEVSAAGGELHTEPLIELKAAGKGSIYYSIDKEDPYSGTKYTEPFKITAGSHVLRAVSVNQYGVVSAETKVIYDVTPGIPDMPEILPSGVNILTDTDITINAPEDCKIYYTWDGSEPTVYSIEYTGPMKAPEGNNILSVIVVDKYGQTSNIAKKNYIVN